MANFQRRSYRNTAHRRTAFPPFPHNPLFPAHRSGPTAGSGADPKRKFLAVTIGSISIPMLGLPDLITAKETAGREQE